MIISLSEFQNYTNVFSDDDTNIKAVQQQYIDAAEKIVIEYIGYDPNSQDYTERFSGDGTKKLSLQKKNITAVSQVKLNSETIDTSSFVLPSGEIDEILYYPEGFFLKGYKNIEVSFTSGWKTVPANIKMTVLQIAALLQTTGGGNIGITSKSFDASGTRTFIQNRKFDDYFVNISNYKVIG